MKVISLEEAKKVELEILLNVADFCDRHGLRYYLAYGTLIGAIRHKGFIPWDDDIDIQMPRPDYNKLIELYNRENENKQYFLIDPKSKNAEHPYVKVVDNRTVKKELGTKKRSLLGVDIDIFPIDGMPSGQAEYDKWYTKLYRCYKRLQYSNTAIKGLKLKAKVHMLLYKPYALCRKGLMKKTEKLHALYPYEECERAGSMETIYSSKKNYMRKEYFDGYTLVEFEGHQFKAPKQYHEVLTCLFGDYMQLPPEEERVTHHTNTMFWKGD